MERSPAVSGSVQSGVGRGDSDNMVLSIEPSSWVGRSDSLGDNFWFKGYQGSSENPKFFPVTEVQGQERDQV